MRAYLPIIFLLIALNIKLYSQIVATPSAGCATLGVTFTGPSGASAILWNLGGSFGTSTLSSPQVNYFSPGNYNITYSAIVNGNPVNYSTVLQVFPAPTANFSYQIPSVRCAPLTATFTGSGGSPGSTYNWSFGDFTSSFNSPANVTHVYNNSGSFVPILTMVDAASGCTAIASPISGGTINVSALPQINITSTQGFVACVPPFTTAISGSLSISGSPIPGPLSFNWTFNGGVPASSSSQNPGIVSFGSGNSTISVIATDNNNCSNSLSLPVTVITQSLSVAIQPTICFNTAFTASVFSTQSIVNFTFSGLGPYSTTLSATSTPTVINPLLSYTTTGGLKSYTAVINPGGNCIPVVQTGTFFVEEILSDFNILPGGVPFSHSTCQPSFVVTYSNMSSVNNSSSLSFTWTATNGGVPVNQVTPTFTTANSMANQSFTMTQNSTNPYTIYNLYPSVIGLYAQSNSIAQCTSTLSMKVGLDTINRPTAWFVKSKSGGCGPLTVTFVDSSFIREDVPQGPGLPYAITNYTFYSNNTPGAPFTTSTIPIPLPVPIPSVSFSMTYTNTGTYYPYLVIETNNGCRDTSFYDVVTVVNPPPVAVSVPASACAGNSVTINITATAMAVPSSSVIDHYHIQTDNNYFSGCVTNANPSFPFTHVGTHTVAAYAYQAGCSNSVVSNQIITIRGPYGSLRYKTNCTPSQRKTVIFFVRLQDAQSAVLNFGDNTNVSITGIVGGNYGDSTIVHTYTASGDYTATLVSVNNLNVGCSSKTASVQVTVRDPNANITYNGQPLLTYTPGVSPAISCTKSRYNFSANTSVDAYTCRGTGYIWKLKTPTYTMPTVESDYPFLGGQTGFWHYPAGSPHPDSTTIFDLNSLDTFRLAGTYTIGLTIRDVNGCKDTETRVFRIGNAKPSFTFNANPVCLSATSVQIINNSQAGQVTPDVISNYVWDFGDGTPTIVTTSGTVNPIHSYLQVSPPSQTFQVRCIGSNVLGCKDTTIKILQVNNPLSNFLSPRNFVCIPQGQGTALTFSANPGFVTYSVSFGDSSPISIWSTYSNSFSNIPHTYYTPGLFTASLVVTDAQGCRSTEIRTISAIGQPTAQISFLGNKNKFCLKDAVVNVQSTSSVNVSPITQYNWTIGNVTNSGTMSALQNIPFYTVGIYPVQLLVSSDFVCNSLDTAIIYVFDPKSKMVVKPTKFCLGDAIQVSLTDSSGGVAGWQWFFGDNVPQPPISANSAPTKTLSYNYNIFPTTANPGQTTLSLTYYAYGKTCPLTEAVELNVIKLDGDFEQQDNLYRHCLGLIDNFRDKTINKFNLQLLYNWDFGGQASGTGPTPTYSFTSPGQYSVKMNIMDAEFGCKTSATKNMTILPLPKASIHLPDSSCPKVPFVVTGSGTPGISGTVTAVLSPSLATDTVKWKLPELTFSLTTSALISTIYSLNVIDKNNCYSTTAIDSIYVQQPAKQVQWDTTVIIGEPIPLNAYAGSNFTYTWMPITTDLNCTKCYTPVSTSTVNITYTVQITDTPLACFTTTNTFKVTIDPRTSVDVPTAFTPNGDGTNDRIYPDGWGIRKLNYFKIFNRWGQLLFETNELKNGWDGYYNGVPQNMETYVYQVSVETYTKETLQKSGTFKLLR